MSRGNLTFKSTCNAALHLLAEKSVGARLPSEAALGEELEASRTTIRAVLRYLSEIGTIRWGGREKILLRHPQASDFFPKEEVEDPVELSRAQFLDWVMRTNAPPGTRLTEAALARELGLSSAMVRDLLAWGLPLGLMAKEPNKSWIMLGFTREYAEEMCDLRGLIEMEAIRRLAAQAKLAQTLQQLAKMEQRHIALLARDDHAMTEFPALDAEFHRMICAAARNRFFNDFANRISIIVHYHYQWNKRDEITRNRAAIREHLDVIQALIEGRGEDAVTAHSSHLKTARATLMGSVDWGGSHRSMAPANGNC